MHKPYNSYSYRLGPTFVWNWHHLIPSPPYRVGFQAAQDVLARAVEVIFRGYDHDDLTGFHANQYNVGPPGSKLIYKPHEESYKYHKPELLKLFSPTNRDVVATGAGPHSAPMRDSSWWLYRLWIRIIRGAPVSCEPCERKVDALITPLSLWLEGRYTCVYIDICIYIYIHIYAYHTIPMLCKPTNITVGAPACIRLFFFSLLELHLQIHQKALCTSHMILLVGSLSKNQFKIDPLH